MRLAHDLGRETRQHLVRRVGCGDEQTDAGWIASPLLNAASCGSYTEFGRGAGCDFRFAAQESPGSFRAWNISVRPRVN